MSLPPYTFVPGKNPHPTRSSEGHRMVWEGAAAVGDRAALDRGIELFDAGFYWEAHEAWEALWKAYGRVGPEADLLKALIKLAAAGVKVREEVLDGVERHAWRAEELLVEAGPAVVLGVRREALAQLARRVAAEGPAMIAEEDGSPVRRVFAWSLVGSGVLAPR